MYSSRQIAKAVRENIMFMWLAARQCPDFRIKTYWRPSLRLFFSFSWKKTT
ncbi:transposase [Paenibacillus sp. BK033]|uniref:transposase n=1 Tax=Paenibacillus sp. BK033 TaxID=2512133 RepID=UPI001FB7BB19|nr:transposase [Paenibacillus sp. BK033]